MLRASMAGLILVACASGVAQADCHHFKWSVAREIALFKDSPEPTESGSAAMLDHAYAVTLKPAESVAFAVPSERAAKAGTFAGVLKLASVDPAGAYEVTLSADAWVDVIQNNVRVKSDNFSGQKDCPAAHKSVRFNLAAGPATLQISNASGAAVTLAVVSAP